MGVAAPVEAVWEALTEVETWPQCWPCVRSVQTLSRGDESGLGAIRRIDWASRLPSVDAGIARQRHHRRALQKAAGREPAVDETDGAADGAADGAGVPVEPRRGDARR